jgi:hypothetical protein
VTELRIKTDALALRQNGSQPRLQLLTPSLEGLGFGFQFIAFAIKRAQVVCVSLSTAEQESLATDAAGVCGDSHHSESFRGEGFGNVTANVVQPFDDVRVVDAANHRIGGVVGVTVKFAVDDA